MLMETSVGSWFGTFDQIQFSLLFSQNPYCQATIVNSLSLYHHSTNKQKNMNFATNEAPPTHFLCPLTGKLMSDPVMSMYGTSFERQAILAWLDNNNKCPVTGKPLKLEGLISNKSLQSLITGWKEVTDYDEGANADNSLLWSSSSDNKDKDEQEGLRKIGLLGNSPLAIEFETHAKEALSKLQLHEKEEQREIITQKSRARAA
jgi:hypothetical protein